MPQPTMSDLHISRALTDFSVRYSQTQNQFVARQVFPAVGVPNRNDEFWQYPREYWFRTDAQKRGPASETYGSGYELTRATFTTDVWAVHKDVDDMSRSNADQQLNLDRDATEFVTAHMMQKYEQLWAGEYFTNGVWGTDRQGVAAGETGTQFRQWNDYANSEPIRNLRDGVIGMAKLTGLKPNTLLLSAEVWDQLQDHPDFLARVSGGATTGTPAVWNEQLLGSMIGVDRVLVAWAIKNTTQDGVAPVAADYDFIYGKNALLLHVNRNPSLNSVTAGMTWNWTGYIGAGSNGIRIKKFRLERNEVDRVEASSAFGFSVIAADLGYMFYDAVA